MKRIVRLTESDLSRIVRRVINESKGIINEETGADILNDFKKSFPNYTLSSDETTASVYKTGSGTIAEYNCNTKKLNYKHAGYVDQMLPFLERICNATA